MRGYGSSTQMLIETQAGAFASPMEMRRRLIY
jgi:hypothetical protein